MKEWSNPQIVSLDVSQTAYNFFEGKVVDGTYQDLSCEDKYSYSSQSPHSKTIFQKDNLEGGTAMRKQWISPEIAAIDIRETMNSIQDNEEPDGVKGAIFPGGKGRVCYCS